MSKFLGFFIAIFLVSPLASATDASCLQAIEIRAVMDEFEERMAPLIVQSLRPIEIRHNDFSLLANEPISGSTEFSQAGPIIIRIAGEKCENLLHRDELRVLLCHELGHVMGGAPFMTFLGHTDTFSSAEGQADFYAASACLPTLFANDDNRPFLQEAERHPELLELCPHTGDDQARGLCMRILTASFHFTQFIHATPAPLPSYGGSSEGAPPQMGETSKNVTLETLTRAYPTTQCRFDTFVQGNRCRAAETFADYTRTPSSPLLCGQTAAEVARPACWFRSTLGTESVE